MIQLLDMNKAGEKLNPVTSFEYTLGAKSNEFHPEGLFSETIFGTQETRERKETYAYIDLNCKVLHPALYKPLYRLNAKVLKVLELKETYNISKTGLLEAAEDGELNGVTSVIKNFEKIISKDEPDGIRSDIKNMLLHQHKNNLAFIDKCLVIPAFYRDAQVEDVSGNLRIPQINEYYQKIIKLGLQIKSLNMEEGTEMYEIHAAKMFQLINDLYDFLISKLSKKQGMIRQDILGKRVDFSGRAVIVGGSTEIKNNEIGVPYKMLVKIYEPFILYYLYNSGNVNRENLTKLLKEYNNTSLSILTLRQVLTDIQKGHVLPKEFDELMRSVVKEVIKDKAIIAKRDPALHAESVRGYYPVLVDGDSIKLAITACGGHNADFDGDQMALYTPLTQEAINEVKEKMVDSKSRDGMGQISDSLDKDSVIGLYTLTKDNIKFKKLTPKIIKDVSELDKLHPNYPIIIDGDTTTVGRYIFNKLVPSKKYKVNKAVNKKIINKMLNDIHNEFDYDIYVKFSHDVLSLGMKYFTLMPSTFALDDLDVPQKVIDLKKQLKGKSLAEAQKIIDEMNATLKDYLEGNQLNLGIMESAGCIKGYAQLGQILGAKGLFAGPGGEVRLVDESYASGMNSHDFFSHGYASRNGIIARVLNTSETGYLSRRLVYALQRVEANPKLEDCGTKRFMTIKADAETAKRLIGRYIYDDNNKLVLFDPSRDIDKVIKLRSPIYCSNRKLCRHCYGELLMRNRTPYVGILAATILGERLSQSTMKLFHLGGTITMKKVDMNKELMGMLDDSHKMLFKKQFVINDNKLVSTNTECRLVVDKRYYNDKKDLYIDDQNVMRMTFGYFTIKVSGYDVDITIDNKIAINLNNCQMTETENEYSLVFNKPNVIIFEAVPTPDIFSEVVKMVDGLMSGRQPYKNADHLCRKIYELYKSQGAGCDLVHYEVLVSNILRDKNNPSYPARLNPKEYNPTSVSLNSISKLESWLQAFEFQDPNEAITTGLLYPRPTDETILEKLVTNNF